MQIPQSISSWLAAIGKWARELSGSCVPGCCQTNYHKNVNSIAAGEKYILGEFNSFMCHRQHDKSITENIQLTTKFPSVSHGLYRKLIYDVDDKIENDQQIILTCRFMLMTHDL